MLGRVLYGTAIARLACILAGVGLATTRLGLVVHELIGHGGVAIACGGRILDIRLFWFAGGWIRYDLPEPKSLAAQIAVAVGGIALEVVIGLVMWLAIRRPTLGGKILRATGAAIVIHGAWYLAVGTFHGFGDGWLLRRELGDARVAVAIVAGLGVLVATYFGARGILGVLAATIPGGRRARVIGMLVALALAGGLQGGLAVAEVQLRIDDTYASLMQTEDQRVVARELAEWDKRQRARGAQIDAAARRARARALADQHREFPFAYVLGGLTVAAVIAGAMRARPGTDDSIPPRLVFLTLAIAVLSIALVIALDVVFV